MLCISAQNQNRRGYQGVGQTMWETNQTKSVRHEAVMSCCTSLEAVGRRRANEGWKAERVGGRRGSGFSDQPWGSFWASTQGGLQEWPWEVFPGLWCVCVFGRGGGSTGYDPPRLLGAASLGPLLQDHWGILTLYRIKSHFYHLLIYFQSAPTGLSNIVCGFEPKM